MIKKLTLLLCVLVSPLAYSVTLVEVFADVYGAWELPAENGVTRWVVIHNLNTAKQDGIFHIEILARKKGDKSWQIVRLKPHMAITHAALLKDIIKPTTGKVYPEPYLDAYQAWLNATDKFICTTSILQCIQ